MSGHDTSPAPTADTAIGAGLRGSIDDRVSSADGDAISAALDAGETPQRHLIHDSYLDHLEMGWVTYVHTIRGARNAYKYICGRVLSELDSR